MDLEYYLRVLNNSSVEVSCGDAEVALRHVGYYGKHGLQGYYEKGGLFCFEGAKILPASFDLLQYDSYNVRLDIDIDGAVHSRSFDGLDWFGLYDVFKRCYTIGDFDKVAFDSFAVCFQHGFRHDKGLIGDNICRLYQYYKNEFGASAPGYEIYLFNKTEDGNIFAGAGQSSQGMTFDPGKLRDWELLSHRMFHAFIDFNLRLKFMLYPPYTWMYEGLAVYHEIEAVKCLGLYEKGEVDPWRDLELRYRYTLSKYGEELTLDPHKEAEYAGCGYKTEFLHYTMAPLIIKANNPQNIVNLLKKGCTPEALTGILSVGLLFEPFELFEFEELTEGEKRKLDYFDYVLETWGIAKEKRSEI